MFGIKTKKDKKIEHLESLLARPMMPYVPLEIKKGDLIPYKAQIILSDGMPVEYAKEEIARGLSESMKHHIKYDIFNDDETGKVIITGVMYMGEY